MSAIFEKVKVQSPQRSQFDLTHDVKTTMRMGQLVPIMCEPVLPGDKFRIGCESLIRFAPLIAPVMHRMDAYVHYFFVPNRLVWDNWENYITNTKLPLTGEIPEHPFITVSPLTPGTMGANYTRLMDWMGIPNPVNSPQNLSVDINPIPFSAYQLIYNEYYRDQNLVQPYDYKLTDGDNNPNIAVLTEWRRRAWEHDYLTSALPFAQKGDPVEIPMSGIVELDNPTFQNGIFRDPLGAVQPGGDVVTNAFGDAQIVGGANPAVTTYDPNGTLVVNQGSATLNDLRIAMRVQEWLEKAARGGTRYTEQNRIHFDVRSSDARLQRPEYITGVKTPITISEVLNTSGDTQPQGTMSGHGISVVSGNYGNYYSEEHGYIIGIMSIMPKTAYQQGVPKHFLKIGNPLDSYAFPVFANLGEQEILKTEVMAYTNVQNEIFGYIPRYSEYKYANNRVAGDFRTTLNFWHLGRIFNPTLPPSLNEGFIQCDATDRVFAVEDPEVDNLWVHVLNKVTAQRALPYFGTPTF